MSQQNQSTNNNQPQIKTKKPPELYLPPLSSKKKTLVLDLDETLVHSQFGPFEIPSDVVINIEIENEVHDIHVLIRPGVKEFLEKMAQLYEIVIFTASISKYAGPLLDILDKEKFCCYRLFREHCTFMNASFVKDLKKLGRNLKDVVIVDNSPMAYSLNNENGIPILTWFDNKEDKELYKLCPILEFLSQVNDVRNYISKIVINNEINYKNAMMIMDDYMRHINKYRYEKNKENLGKNVNIFEENKNNNNNDIIKDNPDNNIDIINNDKNQQQININIINNNITNYIYDNKLPIKDENVSNNIISKEIENKSEKNRFNPNLIIASVNRPENPEILNSLNPLINEENAKYQVNKKKKANMNKKNKIANFKNNYIHNKSESIGSGYKIKDKKYNLNDIFSNNNFNNNYINKNQVRNNTNYNSKSFGKKEVIIKQNSNDINNKAENKNNQKSSSVLSNLSKKSNINKNISVNKKMFSKKSNTNKNNINIYNDGNLTTTHKSEKIILNFGGVEKTYRNYNKKNKNNKKSNNINLLHSVDLDKNELGIFYNNFLKQNSKSIYNEVITTNGPKRNRNKFLKNNKINNKKSSSIDNEMNKIILENKINNFQNPNKNMNNIKLNNDFNYAKKYSNDKKFLFNYTLDEKFKVNKKSSKKEKNPTFNGNNGLLKETQKNNSSININSKNFDLSKSTQMNQRSESMKYLISNKETHKNNKKNINSAKQRPKSSAIFKNAKYDNHKKPINRNSSGRNGKKVNEIKYDIFEILERRGIAKTNRMKFYK